MSNLSFICIKKRWVHAERQKIIPNNVYTHPLSQFSKQSKRNLQKSRTNVYAMWRKA